MSALGRKRTPDDHDDDEKSHAQLPGMRSEAGLSLGLKPHKWPITHGSADPRFPRQLRINP